MERFATNAETLGDTFCWVADTQMIRSHPGVVLALAAQQTRYLTRPVEPGGSSQHEAITAQYQSCHPLFVMYKTDGYDPLFPTVLPFGAQNCL
jgi:hypothetical protein